MVPHSLSTSQVLWQDDERVFRRGSRLDGGKGQPVLFVVPAAEHPSPLTVDQLRHEYELKPALDRAWAVCPVELVREADRIVLVLEDPGGELLDRMLGAPMEMGSFLRLAIGVAAALGKLHQRGVVHKDIKPVHILANEATGEAHLTGFGIASRLARERQSPRAPESLAGTLAYMAPEQTGRMNRSVDSRSDLYALGVVMYEMLTGALPFAATEAMEWVHCHLAKRPLPPVERVKEIPSAISAIVMKLLAKRAEDRYQTAAGLQRDLRHCQTEWEARRRIAEFPLGERDTPDQLLIPEKLYGRQGEVNTLLDAFDRTVKGGAPELVLVSGYPGIGKSSVVNELQPVLVPPRGLFASGKFDQHKRDIPYATLAQALQSLIRPLLTKSEAELGKWRRDLRDALGENGQLIVDLVPELKLVVGDQPPAPEVPAKDAQRRFHLVFRRFIGVFAQREHPLALFLDDLQWLDAATLDLLEDLLTRPELRHLMLIGAYRDNEVDLAHPLMRKLEAIKSAGGKVSEIALGPLVQEHLGQLLADALRCEPERSVPLAQLVREKTGGNPFFAIQFIASLAEEKMLAFDHDAACWSWDLAGIHAKRFTDNVVDLMVMKLARLPARTQTALQQLACIGSVADIGTLSTVLEMSQEQVSAVLWDGVRQGLIEQQDGSYKFIHDRVHEAAYSLIPEASRSDAHVRIGRLLVARLSPEKREERIFDIVNHLNRGVALIASREEREKLADFNRVAGKRAKASTAYASALKYLVAGVALLGDDGWERRGDLMFALELERAECEFLTGEFAAADERLISLSRHTANSAERAALASLHIDVCTELIHSDRAVALALDYLRRVGIEFPAHPTEDDVQCAHDQVTAQLGNLAIEDAVDLPVMSDLESLAAVDILTRILIPAAQTDQNLHKLITCRAVTLSLERGNCDASCLAYLTFGTNTIQRRRDYGTAFRFGQVARELVEARGLKRFEARVYAFFASFIAPWSKHVGTTLDLQRHAFAAANKVGDLTYAGYATCCLHAHLIVAGEPLSEVQRETEVGLAFVQKARFSSAWADYINPQLALIRTLRGLTPKFGCFDGEAMEELAFERHLAASSYLTIQECWYWIRKMQARYFAGEYKDALESSSKAQRLLWISRAHIEEAEYHFYGALCRAASCDSAIADERLQHRDALAEHHRQLEVWAENCPENFANRAALVGAEIARLENRDLDAMRLYETAIRSSRENGFAHNEALAYERASVFYRARGFDQFADTYMRNARARYAAWGADGKVRQLDRLYPGLKPQQPLAGPASTITAPMEGLDLATVIRVSQAVSGEIVLEKLLDIVMRKAMEHAGAERGALIVPHGDELRVAAESGPSGSDVIVSPGETSAVITGMPESILRYVMRTHESVILDDASSGNLFSADPYVAHGRVRSILCLPLLNQAKLTGMLYLENGLAPRVFTAERVLLLKVLASQAAISLENSRLYRDLRRSEAWLSQAQRLSRTGYWVYNPTTMRYLSWSEESYRIWGFDPLQGLPSREGMWQRIHPGDRDRVLQTVQEAIRQKRDFTTEFRILLPDGAVKYLRGTSYHVFSPDGTLVEAVTTTVDLTDQRRAENERERLRQLESDLAHMNRVSMMGELSASLAHEVKQPIASARNNARAAQNFLNMRPPDLAEVREAVGCVVGDVDRAGDIIDRITEQIKKAPLRKAPCDLNAAISEVIGLARNITASNGVAVQTRLADGLLPIQVDRVQLQQVVLNLILNAVEAMASVEAGSRTLLISTVREGAGIVVVVRDSGPGIDRGKLERVFDSFYTTKPDGTGMGLSVCRSIIDAHGGRLWAEANKPRGAVFSFALPGGDESS